MTNVAVVVLDTLRKDYFDEHFDWLPGVRYENAWSTSHWTAPAHASLFTGKYGSEVGTDVKAQQLDCHEPVLAERLREAGYTTRAFSGNVNVSRQFNFHRGFDQFEGSWRLRALDENVFDWDQFITDTRDVGPHRYALGLYRCLTTDCDTVPSLKRGLLLKLRDLGYATGARDDGASRALEFVRNTDFGDREFLFVNLVEAHSPYDPPEEYKTVEPPSVGGLEATFVGPDVEPAVVREAYRNSVRYLSAMYRKLFAQLRADFDVVVTLSDHGELLGEYDAWGHMYGVPPELTHVPLAIYTDEDAETATREESVSLLDVYRTVTSAAGLEADADGRGRNLLEVVDDAEVLTEYHGLSDRYFESLENAGATGYEYLDGYRHGISSGQYYGFQHFDGFRETGDPPYEDPESYLRDRVDPESYLRDRVAELDERRGEETGDLDDAVLAQLEDLGYA